MGRWREIVAEIREYCDGDNQPYDTVVQSFANRIEATLNKLEDLLIAEHEENAKLRLELAKDGGESMERDSGEHKFKALRIENDYHISHSPVINLNAETTVVRMKDDVHVTEISVDMTERKLMISYR